MVPSLQPVHSIVVPAGSFFVTMYTLIFYTEIHFFYCFHLILECNLAFDSTSLTSAVGHGAKSSRTNTDSSIMTDPLNHCLKVGQKTSSPITAMQIRCGLLNFVMLGNGLVDNGQLAIIL